MTNAEWAAWASALGGLGAIASAVWIAVYQTKRAKRLEEQQVDLSAAQRYETIREAQRLSNLILALYGNASYRAPDQPEWLTNVRGYLDRIDELADQIKELQRFAGTNARLFLALGNLASECRFKTESLMSEEQYRLVASTQKRSLPYVIAELDRLI